jgi:DNA-binding MarR family transcriptional regulator
VKAQGSMSADLRSMADVNRLIHEPARLMIVTILYATEQVDFLFLLRETGLTKGNLSAHLTKLEEAGYVKVEKTYRGKVPQTLLSLIPAGRAAFEQYRNQLRLIVDSLSKE